LAIVFGAMAMASDLTRIAISSGISGMLNGYRSGNGLNAIQGGEWDMVLKNLPMAGFQDSQDNILELMSEVPHA
jgi:hypothetical protein